MATRSRIYLDEWMVELYEDRQVWKLIPDWKRVIWVSVLVLFAILPAIFFTVAVIYLFIKGCIVGFADNVLVFLFVSPLIGVILDGIFLPMGVLAVSDFFRTITINQEFVTFKIGFVSIKKIPLSSIKNVDFYQDSVLSILVASGAKIEFKLSDLDCKQELLLLKSILLNDGTAKSTINRLADRNVNMYRERKTEKLICQNFPVDNFWDNMGFAFRRNTVIISRIELVVYKDRLIPIEVFRISKADIESYNVVQENQRKYNIVVMSKLGVLHRLGLYFFTKEDAQKCLEEINKEILW